VRKDALVVHCAAPGLKYPQRVPIWGEDAIRVQPVRAGFPCFGAAVAGYVEATRSGDEEKNRICPPSPLPNTTSDWCTMQVLGAQATAAFGTEPDIREWVATVALNPAATPPVQLERAEVADAIARLGANAPAGLARMSELAQA
jgi:hypothetical protein